MNHLHNLRKIKDVPFPFPYAQMIQVMLMVHTGVTPVLASHLLESRLGAVSITLLVSTSMWSLLYIAQEIDQPFGEDMNDFEVGDMQHRFNQTLLTLLHPLAQKPPILHPDAASPDALALVSSNVHVTGRVQERRFTRMFAGASDGNSANVEPPVDVSAGRKSLHALHQLRQSMRAGSPMDACASDRASMRDPTIVPPSKRKHTPKKRSIMSLMSRASAASTSRDSMRSESAQARGTRGQSSSAEDSATLPDSWRPVATYESVRSGYGKHVSVADAEPCSHPSLEMERGDTRDDMYMFASTGPTESTQV